MKYLFITTAILNLWTLAILISDTAIGGFFEAMFYVILTSWPVYIFIGVFYFLFKGADFLLIDFQTRVPYYLYGFLIPAFSTLFWVNYVGTMSLLAKDTMAEGLLIFGFIFAAILNYGGIGLLVGGISGEIFTRFLTRNNNK